MAKTKKDIKSQGSIVQFEKDRSKSKCRKWQLLVSMGKDPRTVKYATKAGVFHGSYTETTKALRDFIDEIEQDKIQRLRSLYVRGIPRLLSNLHSRLLYDVN